MMFWFFGVGATPPWRPVEQRLDTKERSNELHLKLAAE